MSTPPTPIINLDSPKEIYNVDGIHQWNHDSTESAKNGTLQEWITEPLQMLTSASSASSQSTNNGPNASLSTHTTNDDKNGFAALPASSIGPEQLEPLTSNGQNQPASVPTSNGLAMNSATSNGYYQVYSIPATTSGHHLSVPETSNGHHYQIPTPGTSNGASYGLYNHGLQYTGSNGIAGYSPYMNNGAHMMSSRPPTHIVHQVRPNGGYSVNVLNGGNGYINGMVQGRYVRPGWVSTNKVVNGVKKQKRNRTAFTSNQMMELEQEYARARYLDRTRRIELSEALGLNQRTIKIWFQNRRMKEKKDRLEAESTTDSPPANNNELPIFVQDGSYVPVGIENSQYNPALYAESLPMPAMPQVMPAMPQMMPPSLPQINQMPYLVENSIEQYRPGHAIGVQAPQQPLNGGTENVPVNAEENWDLSWIRSINISDDLELA